ncbi:MFS transporter [Conexibacter sp. DBS9H8]|uniref:MFS transporter n=1 Tax=Conexibacter sp. DBS9H8 TaxID=2937801 RepID=UPI00200D3006|nr:MFS transporter [Conexibacter sp. DBS9H8]
MRRSQRASAAALVLVAINLRLAIAAVPPVLGEIRRSTGLGAAASGLLTAIPVFCFGVCALASPRLIRRLGRGPTLSLVLGGLAAGCLVRLLTPTAALFAGTAIIGAAIAVGNVVVPSVIKADFPDARVLMTAFYSVALFIGGGVAAGLTVPLQHLLDVGWRVAVALWVLVALVGLALWLPHAADGRGEPDGAPAPAAGGLGIGGLWRDLTAWAVTAFMGLQSLGYYATLSWIPTILESHGVSATTAGWLLSFSTLPGMLTALATPLVERRMRRPGRLVLVATGLLGAGYVGLLTGPTGPAAYLVMTLLGLGQGVSLSLALGYIVARAPDARRAAGLSTMAQSVGYMLAGTGPFLLGALHGITGAWPVPIALLIVLLVPFTLAGRFAAAPRFVGAP